MKSSRKILFVIFAIMTIIVFSLKSYASANVVASGDCSAEGSSVTWTYYSDNTMVISGNGEMANNLEYFRMWADYKIENVVVEEGITLIGEGAFREDLKAMKGELRTISISDTVESIGSSAFKSCTKLTEVYIPDSVTNIGELAFSSCYSLKNIDFSEGITSIENATFYNCDSLTSVELPEGVTSIGYSAFYSCDNLEKIKLPETIVSIGGSAFADCLKLEEVVLPNHGIIFGSEVFAETAMLNNSNNYIDGVLYLGNHILAADENEMPLVYFVKNGTKSIAANVFTNKSWLDDGESIYISLPDSIECIGKHAFQYLKISSLPANIKCLDSDAFYYCTFDSAITIPAVIETIKSGSFIGVNTPSITISEGVKVIEEKAFASNSVSSIDIPASVEYIGAAAITSSSLARINVSASNKKYKTEDGVLFSKDGTKLISYPSAKSDEIYEIPQGTTTIAEEAFTMCKKLKTVKIPSSVVLIEPRAFNMTYIENIIFANGPRNLIISGNAFVDSRVLNNIQLPPERVYALMSTAFSNTGFVRNSENWEDGALYLDTILIGFDNYNYELAEEYSVKDGTTVIADYANSCNFSESEEFEVVEYSTTKIVDIPDSIVIIGKWNRIMDTELPSSLERIGSDGVFLDTIKLSEAMKEKYGEDFNGSVDIDDTKLLELLNFNYVYSDWMLYNLPLGYSIGIVDELFILQEGIKGLQDGFGALDMFDLAKGIILPESLDVLGLYSPFNTSILYTETAENQSVTFLNKDTKIYDSADTLLEEMVICGYTGSTAEAYAKKYNRKFVDITDCAHEVTCQRGVIKASCTETGRTGDVYCQYCAEFISKGMVVPVNMHTFSDWEIKQSATCIDAGLETRKCIGCNLEESRTVLETGHLWDKNGYLVLYTCDATCTMDKYDVIKCYNCSEYKEIVYANTATGHFDYNFDGYCDDCSNLLGIIKNCSCNCHNDGILGFFWKIINFFQKLFGINPVCECGEAHY